MKLTVLLVVFLAAAFEEAHGIVRVKRLRRNNLNTCQDGEVSVPVGTSQPFGGCGRATCRWGHRRTDMVLTEETCNAVRFRPPCKVVVDRRPPFPKCCPRVVCPIW